MHKFEQIVSAILTGKKLTIEPILQSEESKIIDFANSNLMAGFILESLDFHCRNLELVQKLRVMQRLAVVKSISMAQELQKIKKAFAHNNIDLLLLKGAALKAMTIYDHTIRASRDIDILVPLANLDDAYASLKSLGYRYLNKKSADQAIILGKHHIPPMINSKGDIIELHWRITKLEHFETCPLARLVCETKVELRENSGIFVPRLDFFLVHLLYHGVRHHERSGNPVYIFDMASIFKFNGMQWPESSELIGLMGLQHNYEITTAFIERCFDKTTNSCYFRRTHSVNINEFIQCPNSISSPKLVLSDLNYEYLIKKLKATSHTYQLPYHSFKFWFILVGEFFKALRKLKLR